MTHRFTRPLSCDVCPNSVWGDALGLDSGARIGLEFRYGIAPNTQVVVHRTSDKTIELLGQYGLAASGHAIAARSVPARGGRHQRRRPAGRGQSVLAGDRRDPHAAGWRTGRPLPRADLDAATPTCSTRRPPTTTRSCSASAPACGCATRSILSASSPLACQATAPASATAASPSRNAPAGTCFRSTSPTHSRSTLGQIARGGTQTVRANGTPRHRLVSGVQYLEEILLTI